MKIYITKSKPKRIGGVLIEAVVASALLVTATVALSRFVVSSKRLGTAADNRFASQLVIGNAIERLRFVSAKDWPAQADSIAQAVSAASGIRTQIEMESFQVGQRDAWHATIRCQIGKNENAFQESHAWKVIQ